MENKTCSTLGSLIQEEVRELGLPPLGEAELKVFEDECYRRLMEKPMISPPTQVGDIISVSPQPRPNLWNVHYAYKMDDGKQREMIVVVGRDVPTWASPDSEITVPGPGFSGFVKLPCPEIVRWSTFGRGNERTASIFSY